MVMNCLWWGREPWVLFCDFWNDAHCQLLAYTWDSVVSKLSFHCSDQLDSHGFSGEMACDTTFSTFFSIAGQYCRLGFGCHTKILWQLWQFGCIVYVLLLCVSGWLTHECGCIVSIVLATLTTSHSLTVLGSFILVSFPGYSTFTQRASDVKPTINWSHMFVCKVLVFA